MRRMLDSVQTLPEDPIQLQRIIAQLQGQLAEAQRARTVQAEQIEAQTNTIAEHTRRIEQLLETIELLRRKRFGPSADRIPEDQLALFDEAELEALIGELEAALPAPRRPSASRCAALCPNTCRAWSASSICPTPRRRPWAQTGRSSAMTAPSSWPSSRASATWLSPSAPSTCPPTRTFPVPRSA
jgi:hypothetical protein